MPLILCLQVALRQAPSQSCMASSGAARHSCATRCASHVRWDTIAYNSRRLWGDGRSQLLCVRHCQNNNTLHVYSTQVGSMCIDQHTVCLQQDPCTLLTAAPLLTLLLLLPPAVAN